MNKLLRYSLVFGILLVFDFLFTHVTPKITYGQSCNGSVSCGSRVNVVCQPGNCTPGTPGCSCRDECVGLTVPASCSGYGGSIAQCNASAICEVYNARCLKSGSCQYTPPAAYCGDGVCNGSETSSTCPSDCGTSGGGGTNPTTPPGGGGSCSGQCLGPVWNGTTMQNCGTIGKASASGSCSGGAFCCQEPSGDGGSVCGLGTLTPQIVNVGENVVVTIDARNSRSSWTDDNIWIDEIDTGANNKIWVTNTEGEMNNATNNPFYRQPSGVGKTLCCSAGGNDTNPRYYRWTIRGVNPGTDNVRIRYRVFTGSHPGTDSQTCTKNFNITVRERPKWVQVNDGDLITNGRVNIAVPPNQFLIGSLGSDEGIVTYNPLLNIGGGQVSPRGWNSRITSSPSSLQYQLLVEQIPSGTAVTNIPSSINNSSLNPVPQRKDPQGYEWFRVSGDAVISSDITMPAGKKVIIFVDGNVRINGSIRITNPTNSFFMLAANNSITVAPPVGSQATDSTPDLEGIFYTSNQFIAERGAGPENSRLNIYGTVVALNGVSLLRDTQSEGPSETFTFNPNLLVNFPPSLGIRRAFWKEVAP